MNAHSPPIPSIGSLARDCLRACKGNIVSAAAEMLGRLRDDETLMLACMEELIAEAARVEIEAAHRHTRAAILSGIGKPPRVDGDVKLNAIAATFSLFDYPLAGGLKLGDATRDEIEAQATIHRAAAIDHGHKARWFQAIAAECPAGKPVRAAINAARLEKLFEQARKP